MARRPSTGEEGQRLRGDGAGGCYSCILDISGYHGCWHIILGDWRAVEGGTRSQNSGAIDGGVYQAIEIPA